MAKSQDAFRTISEVSDWLDTPAHVLRFWESKFTQIKPVKRAGGRRYYRPDDMALLSGIKILLHDQGMTIKGVQKLLREQGVRHVIDIGVTPAPGGLTLDGDWLDADADVAMEAEAALADDTQAPETQAPETLAPETLAPETPTEEPRVEEPRVEEIARIPAPPAEGLPDDLPDESAKVAAAASAPEPEPEPQPPREALPPAAAWHDPWPTDPTPKTAPNAAEGPRSDTSDWQDGPAEAAPVAVPPPAAPREVSLPFVRARTEASDTRAATGTGDTLAFAPRVRPPIPTIPDERGYTGRAGMLTALTGGDRAAVRAAIRGHAAQIAPLVARLKVMSDRIANPRD